MSPTDIPEDELLAYRDTDELNHKGILLAAYRDGHITTLQLNVALSDRRNTWLHVEAPKPKH